MEKYYIGWDVGAWHCEDTGKGSKDAITILDANRHLIGSIWEGNLTEVIRKTVIENEAKRTSFFIEEIFSLCEAKAEYKKDASFCIAIDTPLGWTKSFLELLTMWSYNKNNDVLNIGNMRTKNENRLLTRETENLLGGALSAIQDQIGSQSTKAMYLLSSFKPSRPFTGVWKTESPKLTIIETYPAPCMRSLDFIQHMENIIQNKETIFSADKFDSLICANLAWCFGNPPTPTLQSVQIGSPVAGIDPAEGWIFTPENILDKGNGISYPKLIDTKQVQKLKKLLSKIQIAMILSVKEKKKTDIDEWAKENSILFCDFDFDYWVTEFKTLHPSWFKVELSKTPKYTVEQFKDFLKTTITSLQ